MTRTSTTFRQALVLLMLLVSILPGAVTAAEDGQAGEPRVSRSAYFGQDGRDQQHPDKISLDEVATGNDAAAKPGRRGDRSKGSPAQGESPNTEFWFYHVDVVLFADEDLDGYFYGIDLLFDADTIYEFADVYAVLYLSREGGPWYEYAATDVFSLYGATSDDDFVVVSELLSGYPAGSYDLLVELYDTWDGALVAEIGPADSSELGYLPLEDAERDEPYVPPEVIVVEEGGGSIDTATLLLLAVALAGGFFTRRRRALRQAAAPAGGARCA